MLRQIVVVVLVAFVGISTAGPANATSTSSADLAVELDSFGGLLEADIYYDVSVTNNGPQPVTSATVVVRLDPRARSILTSTTSCSLDTATDLATCAFGAVAVGATAKLNAWIYFDLPLAHTYVAATAALVSSAPADPNPANDSANLRCEYTNHYPGFPPYPYRMRNCRPFA